MANCNVIRDKNDKIEYAEAPNGARSILYDNLLEKLGDIPKARDAVTVGNLVFEIEEADERRITKVRITRFDDSLNETL